MADVLNPYLYQRLARVFGPVKVTARREAMDYRMAKDYGGKDYMSILHAGEYYCVSCPYCRDTRQRLYVSHMLGQMDEKKRCITFLVTCFNENCMNNPANKKDFLQKVDEFSLVSAKIETGVKVPEEARVVLLPGACVSVAKLKDNHPCRVYIRSRGFDPDKLARLYDIQFCLQSHFGLATDRLIIPIYERGKLKGWQARYVGELDWKGPNRKGLPPKYFSCPDSDFRSKCIYNFETMQQWQTGVIVEGPTDAWRFGPMAGCIFGNTMTERQREKFRFKFKRRTAVILLDPEEFESKSTDKLREYFFGNLKNQVCFVKLPEHTDPGGLDRQYLRDYVREQAAIQGVKVQYKKVG